MTRKEKGSPEAEESFEQVLKRLEEIVQRLEHGDLALEESLRLFEEGVRLTRVCALRLDRAEKRIEIMTRDEHGEVRVKEGNAELFQQKTENGEGENQT